MRYRTTRSIVAVVALLAGVARGADEPDVPRILTTDAWYKEYARRAYELDEVLRADLELRLARLANAEVTPTAYNDFLQTLTLAAFYPLDAVGPTLVRFHRETRGAFVEPVAEIAACYRTQEAERFQRTLLADPMLRSIRARTRLLIALAERGDGAAIDALVQQVASLDPATAKTSDVFDLFRCLETARVPTLPQRIAALPMPPEPMTSPSSQATRPAELTAREADAGVIRGTLPGARRWLSETLAMSLLSPGELMDAIERIGRADDPRRVSVALALLAKSGSVQDVPRLAKLPLGVNTAYGKAEAFERARTRATAIMKARPKPVPLPAVAAATSQPASPTTPQSVRGGRTSQPAPTVSLRLVPLAEEILATTGTEGETLKKARRFGLDPAKLPSPFVAHVWQADRKRLFYVFGNVFEAANAPRPWLIQRIRRTERLFPANGSPPVTEIAHSVQVFRLRDGATSGINQHDAIYSLGQSARREIVKEFEVGFGEIDGVLEGLSWPFEQRSTAKMLQTDEEDATLFKSVRFTTSIKWSIKVVIEKDGTYSVACPELGFELPRKLPKPPAP